MPPGKCDNENFNPSQFIGDYGDHPKIEIPGNLQIHHTRDIAKLARCIADKEQEYVMIVSLDLGMHVLNARIVSIGGRETTTFSPGPVFRGAIIDRASEIIMVHNHPGRDLDPTKADRKVLKMMIKAGKLLDINVIDSIIVHGKHYRSMVK